LKRYLRVAVFAFSLVACVSISTMWVRSHYWFDYLAISSNPRTVGQSWRGQVRLSIEPGRLARPRLVSAPAREYALLVKGLRNRNGQKYWRSGFHYELQPGLEYALVAPYWFLTPISLVIALIAKHKPLWRCSLAEILAVMSFAAIAAGLVAWVSRLGS
jgi:hypothetical protein